MSNPSFPDGPPVGADADVAYAESADVPTTDQTTVEQAPSLAPVGHAEPPAVVEHEDGTKELVEPVVVIHDTTPPVLAPEDQPAPVADGIIARHWGPLTDEEQEPAPVGGHTQTEPVGADLVPEAEEPAAYADAAPAVELDESEQPAPVDGQTWVDVAPEDLPAPRVGA